MDNENTRHPELHIPFVERLKSIPEIFGIRVNEEPKYKTLLKEGAFEIREYEPQIHAQITVTGRSFDRLREIAFKKLAAYIFGGNTPNENVSMTSPVILQPSGDEDTWTMAFILPSKFDQFTAPTPLDPDIKIGSRPAHTVAAVTYSGNNTLEKMKEQEKNLTNWLHQKKDYGTAGQAVFAQYDAPFTLPFVKRNEVQIELLRIH